jgi:hypothetical protein
MVLMPLVIAVVGIGGTYFITAQQEKNAKTSKDAQLEESGPARADTGPAFAGRAGPFSGGEAGNSRPGRGTCGA